MGTAQPNSTDLAIGAGWIPILDCGLLQPLPDDRLDLVALVRRRVVPRAQPEHLVPATHGIIVPEGKGDPEPDHRGHGSDRRADLHRRIHNALPSSSSGSPPKNINALALAMVSCMAELGAAFVG